MTWEQQLETVLWEFVPNNFFHFPTFFFQCVLVLWRERLIECLFFFRIVHVWSQAMVGTLRSIVHYEGENVWSPQLGTQIVFLVDGWILSSTSLDSYSVDEKTNKKNTLFMETSWSITAKSTPSNCFGNHTASEGKRTPSWLRYNKPMAYPMRGF